MTTNTGKLQIILIHGIWMKGLEMLILRNRLTFHGYKVKQFTYWSLLKQPNENAINLKKTIEHIEDDCIIVAHSLGGMIVRKMFENHSSQLNQVKGVVSLGSPLKGSKVAQFMSKRKLLKWGLGASNNILCEGVKEWDQPIPWLSIAGTRNFGVGRYMGGVNQYSDGTVEVRETKLNGTEHDSTYPSSHMGLLFSSPVTQKIISFINKVQHQKPSESLEIDKNKVNTRKISD